MSSMAAISLLSSPPLGVKNLSPLRLNGRWLAVTITEAVALVWSLTVVINMAGVEASPQSSISAPILTAPLMKVALTASPDRRQSAPIAIVGCWLPVVLLIHFTKALAIVSTTSGVKLTFSPSMPSSATPLMSEPFCSFFQFICISLLKVCLVVSLNPEFACSFLSTKQ